MVEAPTHEQAQRRRGATRRGRAGRGLTSRARSGRRRTLEPCAESSGTSVTSRRSTSSSRVCAGWSTAATTPPASPSSPTARSPAASGPASSPTSRRCSPSTRCRRPASGIGHTRWATHGAPNDRNAHPHLDATGTRRGHPQRHHRELRRAARRARGARRTRCARDTDTEVVAHLLAEEYAPTGRDLAEAMRAGVPPARGRVHPASPCTPTHPTSSSARGATPRWSSGVGDGENFLGSDVAAFIAHTREAIELGQDQVVELRRDGVTVTDFDGEPGRRAASTTSTGTRRPPRRAATTTSCSRRSPSSRGPSPTPCSAASTPTGRLHARRDAAVRRGAARHRQGRHRRLRHGVPRRAAREVRHRALDPHPVRGRARQRVPLPRPDPRPATRWSSRSRSPARRWTR